MTATATANDKLTFSFYPGCTEHSTGMEYGMSTHAVFGMLGVKFEEVEDWNCCGGAAAHCLSKLLGLALPARNIAQAQKTDRPLAIPCPGCFNAVKRARHALTNDPEMKDRLERIVGFKYNGNLQVKAMHEVLLDYIGLDKLKPLIKTPLTGLKVVSYYGCALVRDPKIVEGGDPENPIFLDDIVTALGGEALDWSYKADCCGADLSMTHGKIAIELADKLAAAAIEVGADCIMTSCGLCQINLDTKQSAYPEDKIPVMYFTELMGIAMDLPNRDEWWDMHVARVYPMLGELGLL